MSKKSNTYYLCKRLAEKGHDQEDLKQKIDTFLMANRLNEAEYKELIVFIEEKNKKK